MTTHTRIRTLGATVLPALAFVGRAAGQAGTMPRRPRDDGIRRANCDRVAGD